MKTGIIRVIGASLLLALTGCGAGEETPATSADKVFLTLDVATTRGDGSTTGELPEAEKIHTLRVIIFDGNGRVEHNTLIYDDAAVGVEEVADKTFEVTKNDRKTLFLLANAEELPGLDPTNPEGLQTRITEYDQVSLDWLQGCDALPMSSSYNFSVQDKNKDCGTLYVAYAATKFTFSFENRMPAGSSLGISGLTINQIASTSYLYPQASDRWLTELLNGRIVTAYEIPATAVHAPFLWEDFERVVIPSGDTYAFPPIYLPESRNINDLDTEQSYTAGLKIGLGDDALNDHIRDVRLSDGSSELNSLFRGTHVKVKVVVKSLEQIDILIGIYGMIEPWTELDPVSGSIIEK